MDRRIIEEKDGWKRINRKIRTGKLSGWAYIVELGRRREREREREWERWKKIKTKKRLKVTH